MLALLTAAVAGGWLWPGRPGPGQALAAGPAGLGPTFEAGPCPFAAGGIPAGDRVDCGYLIVPEDRSQPEGAAIRLAVAVLRTHNPTPALDPILFLADGPGAGSLDWLNYFLTDA